MTLNAANLPAADVSDAEFLAEDTPAETQETETTEETPSGEEEASSEEETPEETEETTEEEEKVEESEEDKDVPEDSKALVAKLREVDPQIFKKVPYLRSIIYSQREFSKIFADPNEARQVYDDYESLSMLSQDILTGNVKSLLDAVAQDKNGALEKVAKNFLPTLYQTNENLFLKVSLPIVNNVFRAAMAEAKNSGNKNLELAVRYMTKFVHGDPNIPDDRPRPDPEKERLQKELENRDVKEDMHFEGQVRTHAAQYLADTVDKAINPKFVGLQREAIARKITETIYDILENDADHNRVMNSLWKRAKIYGKDGALAQRLITTYINKARVLLPGVTSKVIAGFNGTKPISRAKPQFPQSGGGSSKGKTVTSKDVDYRKSSDMDILLDRATLKKS